MQQAEATMSHKEKAKYWFVTLVLSLAYGALWFFVIYKMSHNRSDIFIYVLNVLFMFFILIVSNIIYPKGLVYAKGTATGRTKFAMMIYSLKILPFQSMLYMYYIFIILASQIQRLQGGLWVSEYVRRFFSIQEYSIVLLVAVDRLISQMQKDYKKGKKHASKLIIENDSPAESG